MQEMFKKHPHNQYFLVRGGLAFIMKKSEPLIIKEFGQGFYAVSSFTGQQYYEDNYIVGEDIENEYIKYEAFLNKMPLKKVENFRKHFNCPLPKCLVVGEPTKLAELEKKMHEKQKDVMSVYRSEPFFLELLPLGIDKAKSLAVLLERIGLTREEMMACGDGFNDLSMIQFAGMGVAMANAQDVVKEAANHITVSNEECGVAKVVEEFFLNRIS